MPLCQLATVMQVLVSHSCLICVQGEQLVVYGGESPHKADENEAGNVADAGNKVYNDLVILEPDMRLWIGLSVTGIILEDLPNLCTQTPKRLLLCLRTIYCRRFHEQCQSLFRTLHNSFRYFPQWGQSNWWLLQDSEQP